MAREEKTCKYCGKPVTAVYRLLDYERARIFLLKPWVVLGVLYYCGLEKCLNKWLGYS